MCGVANIQAIAIIVLGIYEHIVAHNQFATATRQVNATVVGLLCSSRCHHIGFDECIVLVSNIYAFRAGIGNSVATHHQSLFSGVSQIACSSKIQCYISTFEHTVLNGHEIVVASLLVECFGLHQAHPRRAGNHRVGFHYTITECEVATLIVDMHCIRVRLALWLKAQVLEDNIGRVHYCKHAVFCFAICRFGVSRAGNHHLCAVARLRSELNGMFSRYAINLINHHIFGISAIFNQECHRTLDAIGKSIYGIADCCIISLARRAYCVFATQSLGHAAGGGNCINLFGSNVFTAYGERCQPGCYGIVLLCIGGNIHRKPEIVFAIRFYRHVLGRNKHDLAVGRHRTGKQLAVAEVLSRSSVIEFRHCNVACRGGAVERKLEGIYRQRILVARHIHFHPQQFSIGRTSHNCAFARSSSRSNGTHLVVFTLMKCNFNLKSIGERCIRRSDKTHRNRAVGSLRHQINRAGGAAEIC